MEQKLFFIFLVCILKSKILVSQSTCNLPLMDYKVQKSELTEITNRFKELNAPFTRENNSKNTYIKKEIASIPNYLKKLDSNELLISKGKIFDDVNFIFDKIKKANQNYINENYNLYIYRSSIPNASNLGGGIILINLGLISNLESEDELAYILCHELSHDINRDVLKGISQDANYRTNAEVKSEVKKAKKQKYGSKTSLTKLYHSYRSSITEYSRETELIADSLGFYLYLNTYYNPFESTKALKLLDSIDYLVYNSDLNLKKEFNFNNYSFKESWLQQENQLLWTNKEIKSIPNDLKTHPDCEIRINQINRYINLQSELVKTKKNHEDTLDFKKTIEYSKIEIVEYLNHSEQYGLALFHAIRYKADYYNNAFFNQAILHNLIEIKNALKSHHYTSVVDSPDPEYSNSYNQFLQFLNNISTSEYNSIISSYFNERIKEETSIYIQYLKLINENESMTKEKYDYFYSNNKEKANCEYFFTKLKNKIPIKKK